MMNKLVTSPSQRDGDKTTLSIDQIRKNPAAYFNTPDDVIDNQQYTDGEKLEILRAWELDARQLQVAADENMDGGKDPCLDKVVTALMRLGHEPSAHNDATKVGG